MCISVHMICNKMYINNESCRCIDAKSWKCSAETFLILSKLKITIFPFFIVFDALKYPFFKVVPLDFQFLAVTLIIMLLMDNSWDTKWKSLKRHFFQVEIKRSLPNIKDFFTKKQLYGHLEMVLLLAKIKKKIKIY